MGLIYLAENTINNSLYIGQTTKTLDWRRYHHIYSANNGSDLTFSRAIRKYGSEKFNWKILQDLPDAELDNAEREFIHVYKLLGLRLYNETEGGNGGRQSDEVRQKMSEAQLGRVHTDETRQKMSKAKLGRKCPKETVDKLAKTYNIVLQSPDGAFYGPITNLSAFSRKHGLSSSHLFRLIVGKRNSYRGWIRARDLIEL